MARARGDGFQGDVTWNAKRYRAGGFKTLIAAEVWEHQALAALKVGHQAPPGPTEAEASDWTLGAMLDWAYKVHWSTMADPTYFEKQIGVVKKDLGPNYPAVDLIGADGYAKIKAACELRGNSGETINKKASLVSKALKLSIEQGKLQGVLKPQYARLPASAGRDRILTRDEETACLAWARQVDASFYDWFMLGIDTGYRSYSEGLHIYPLVDVRGEDLFIRGRVLEDGAAVYPKVVDLNAVRRRTKTGEGKSRVIGLTRRALEIVSRHKAKLHNTPNARMFEDLTKQRITDRWNLMKSQLRITDEDFVPYSLRHTFGTRCILAGVTVDELRVLMGHSTTKQTLKYVHLAGLVQRGAAVKLDKFLEG